VYTNDATFEDFFTGVENLRVKEMDIVKRNDEAPKICQSTV
jgi:hypothetical protein